MRSMMRAAVGAFLAVTAVSGFGRAASGERGRYAVMQVTSTAPEPDLVRTDYRIERGNQTLNRFHVLRVRRTPPLHPPGAPVILLSPFGFPAEYWELTAAGSYGDTFAARLARAGNDVWLVDSRIANLAPGTANRGPRTAPRCPAGGSTPPWTTPCSSAI